MKALSPQDMLALWDRGARLHPLERALWLLMAGCPEAAAGDLARLPIDERDHLLLELRVLSFGRDLQAVVACPECGEWLEFAVPTEALLDAPTSLTRGAVQEVVVDGCPVRVRVPSSEDLLAVAGRGEEEEGRALLLDLCVESDAARPLSHEQRRLAFEGLTEALPSADVVFDLHCQQCQHAWREPFDIGEFLWTEVRARARRLLLEIHALASAYGWREADVLALSSKRRRAYLSMVGGMSNFTERTVQRSLGAPSRIQPRIAPFTAPEPWEGDATSGLELSMEVEAPRYAAPRHPPQAAAPRADTPPWKSAPVEAFPGGTQEPARAPSAESPGEPPRTVAAGETFGPPLAPYASRPPPAGGEAGLFAHDPSQAPATPPLRTAEAVRVSPGHAVAQRAGDEAESGLKALSLPEAPVVPSFRPEASVPSSRVLRSPQDATPRADAPSFNTSGATRRALPHDRTALRAASGHTHSSNKPRTPTPLPEEPTAPFEVTEERQRALPRPAAAIVEDVPPRLPTRAPGPLESDVAGAPPRVEHAPQAAAETRARVTSPARRSVRGEPTYAVFDDLPTPPGRRDAAGEGERTVRINIGRVEVRAAPPAQPRQDAQGIARPAAFVSLQQYLRARKERA